MSEIKVDQVIDIKGLNCPLPVLKTKRALELLKPGQVLKVIATDPGVKIDIPALLDRLGDELLRMDEKDGELIFFIRRNERQN